MTYWPKTTYNADDVVLDPEEKFGDYRTQLQPYNDNVNNEQIFRCDFKYSDIVAITRLVAVLNNDNQSIFLKTLTKLLNCENESQLLCQFINLLWKTNLLTQNSIDILKNTALNLAAKQTVKVKVKVKSKNDNDDNIVKYTNTNISMVNYIAEKDPKKYINDHLSVLNSDIINVIGSYLNKSQSIKFGSLINRNLYIATQNKQYLLKQTDWTLTINDNHLIDLLSSKKSNPFYYNYPTSLILDIDNFEPEYDQILLSKWFKSLFTRLHTLEIASVFFLPYIPISLLFGHSNENIRLLKFDFRCEIMHDPPERMENFIDDFCDRFQMAKQQMKDNNQMQGVCVCLNVRIFMSSFFLLVFLQIFLLNFCSRI